jgi:putative tricarboxylic transport membrane protein
MIGFGILGFLLRKRKYELAPFALSLVLAPMVEQALRQSLIMAHGSPMIFVTRPICASLLAVATICLVGFALGEWRKRGTIAASIPNQSKNG